MWIERDLMRVLPRLAGQFPALVLVGPRQVGKTSLLIQAFPDHRYVTLDAPALAEMAETRAQAFLAEYPRPVILDEVQYAPALFRHIKVVIDAHRNQPGQFILTGSQNFTLMREVADSLAGRAAVIPMLGLSASEWRARPQADDAISWAEFLWRGGYPALWAEPSNPPERDRWYQGYVATYLERDVRNLLNVGSLRDFDRFLRACAARCAQTLNMSEIGRDVGISATTARQWVSVLQASNQIFLLEPYYRSLGKRLAKSPKLYFTDTGLAAYLMGYQTAQGLMAGREAGALWENHVVTQWLRWRDWHAPAAGLWYWRDQGGNEVDLLIELEGRIEAIECKLTERPEARDARGIARLRAFYGAERVARGWIACTTAQSYILPSEVVAMPGWTVWPLAR